MPTPNEQFLLEEAGATRELIRSSIAEARALERYCLVVTAAVWTWLLSTAQGEIVKLGYWIPLFFVSLALIRVVALYLDIRVAAGYLRDVEVWFLPSGKPEGWETRRNPGGGYRLPLAPALFWPLLLLVALVGPMLLRSQAR